MRAGEGEAEATRRRKGLLVRREQLQQLEFFQRSKGRRVINRPRWRRRPAREAIQTSPYAAFLGATTPLSKKVGCITLLRLKCLRIKEWAQPEARIVKNDHGFVLGELLGHSRVETAQRLKPPGGFN